MSGFNLSALAVRERAVTLFLLVAISIAGVVAFLTLGRAEDPAFTVKQMTVVTAWPGATAREMEETARRPPTSPSSSIRRGRSSATRPTACRVA
jgi:multidrug efflux pump subunit AcrB